MAATRRLAAILAADVANYSRLMGADEEGTHERLKKHFQQLIHPKIREHQGRVVKNTGDGTLVEFASVVDAMRCAAEIQRGMIDRDTGMPAERRINLRIGVNLGDVIVEDGDIFGDGVNVASRLENLAQPGGICVSGIVHDQVRDRLPYLLEDMGEQSVRNIARPVRVYALSPEAVANLPALDLPAATTTALSRPAVVPRLSIVVLPFSSLSNNPRQQYFADAITEDLTTDLSRIADMLVISRNTAFTYRNKTVDTKQIGRELGVRYVLTGSVQRSRNKIRVTAQLVDVNTDSHRWAERFAGDIDNLFVVQDEITSRIAIALDRELVSAVAEGTRQTEHPDAIDYIFRGRAALLNPPSRDNYATVVGLFERSLAIGPASVDTKAWLAVALAGRVLDQMTDSATDDIKRAEGLIENVLAVAPRHARSRFAKGQILRAQNRFEDAVPEYETAVALNPNWVEAFSALAFCGLLTGAIEDTIPAYERAIRLSPDNPLIGRWYWRIGMAHLLQSRAGQAITWLEKARTANPKSAGPRAWLASAYALIGDSDRAVAELSEARRLCVDNRYSSITHFNRAVPFFSAKTRALAETSFFVGLRRAGVSEE